MQHPHVRDLTLGLAGAFIVMFLAALGQALHPDDATARPAPCVTPREAIDCVFPRHLRAKAKRVAECESTASAPEHLARRRGLGRWARDYATGTHWGVFQLGPDERAAHGPYRVGSPALIQVRAAHTASTKHASGSPGTPRATAGARGNTPRPARGPLLVPAPLVVQPPPAKEPA